MLDVNCNENSNLIQNQKKIRYTNEETTGELLESYNVRIDYKLIQRFNLMMSLLYFSVALLTLAPQLIIINTTDKIKQAIIMQAFWWVILPVLFIFLSVCLFAFFNKRLLTKAEGSYFIVVLFCFYLISLLFLFSIGTLFCFELFVGLSCTLIACYGLLSVLNFFRIFDNKKWIKMICLSVISFVALILYLILAHKRIVEFFVINLIILMISYYIVNNTTLVLIEYVKVYGLTSDTESFELKWYLLTAVVSNVEFVAVCFK